jgi:hypothetical protein
MNQVQGATIMARTRSTFRALAELAPLLRRVDDGALPIVNGVSIGAGARKEQTTFAPRRDPSRAVDILLTHSTLPVDPANKTDLEEQIVGAINPVLHLVGHDHSLHGLHTGCLRSAAGAKRFTGDIAGSANGLGDIPRRHIPVLNGSIVAELHKWNPPLQAPVVFDVIPIR